jgi:YD repeat-containing protein
MTDREKNGLKGPVKTCADAISRWSYHPDGSLAEVQHRNPDGSKWTTEYVYDEAGRLSEARSQWGVLTYHYTPQGELDRVTSGERVVESWGRDERGRKTRTRHVDAPPGGATAITTVYDGAGRLIEEAQHPPLPAGMLEKMGPEQIEAVQALFVGRWKRRHRYDVDGHRVETTTEFGPLGGERMTLAYNEHGDEVERIVVEFTRELSLDEKGRPIEPDQPPVERRFEVRLEYQYDEHGNWTEQVVSSRQKPDEAFTVTNTERRTVAYY